jgi:hypothetical protein
MRLPRVRFTARLMMVIIAVVAIILAVTHQVQEGRRQVAVHSVKSVFPKILRIG